MTTSATSNTPSLETTLAKMLPKQPLERPLFSPESPSSLFSRTTVKLSLAAKEFLMTCSLYFPPAIDETGQQIFTIPTEGDPKSQLNLLYGNFPRLTPEESLEVVQDRRIYPLLQSLHDQAKIIDLDLVDQLREAVAKTRQSLDEEVPGFKDRKDRDFSEVIRLLGEGANSTYGDKDQPSVLQLTQEAGDTQALEVLLSHGVYDDSEQGTAPRSQRPSFSGAIERLRRSPAAPQEEKVIHTAERERTFLQRNRTFMNLSLAALTVTAGVYARVSDCLNAEEQESSFWDNFRAQDADPTTLGCVTQAFGFAD